jgi:hypothetical protein
MIDFAKLYISVVVSFMLSQFFGHKNYNDTKLSLDDFKNPRIVISLDKISFTI